MIDVGKEQIGKNIMTLINIPVKIKTFQKQQIADGAEFFIFKKSLVGEKQVNISLLNFFSMVQNKVKVGGKPEKIDGQKRNYQYQKRT